MSVGYAVLITASALAVYSFLHYRLQIAAQPLRLGIAARGERLLASPHLNDAQKTTVEDMLNSAYSGWMAIVFCIMLPLMTLYYSFNKTALAASLRVDQVPHQETRDQCNQLKFRYMLSLMAGNMLFGALLVVEIVVMALVSAALSGSVDALKLTLGVLLRKDRDMIGRITGAQQH